MLNDRVRPSLCIVRTVLMVDPHGDTRAMYGTYLRGQEWRIIEAEDGRLALATALTLMPQVVVTELNLMGMSGFDLCRELRADPATSRVPIIMLTGDAHAATPERARASGADVVLA